jgi:hypothetical protein
MALDRRWLAAIWMLALAGGLVLSIGVPAALSIVADLL